MPLSAGHTCPHALAPDQIAIAVAALGQLQQQEAHRLEKQWTFLRRERARDRGERARRQYDAVEPENRLVAALAGASLGREAARRGNGQTGIRSGGAARSRLS